MNEWYFIGAAFALTWVTLAGYAAYVTRRAARAERAMRAAYGAGEERR